MTTMETLSHDGNAWPTVPRAWMSRFVSIGVAIGFVATIAFTTAPDSTMSAMLLDRQPYSIFPFPFTIQTLVYVALAWAMADLYRRWCAARRERAFIAAHFLPEDSSTMLQLNELGPIRRRIAGLYDEDSGFLPYLMDLTILQLQASGSVDQAMNVLTNSISLMSDQVDLRYQMLRYMAWLIPTIGFLGTIIGLSLALHLIDPHHMDLARVVGGLSVSFYTTLVALISSAILAFVQHTVQEQEELALNAAGRYCLKNLINRVYIDRDSVGAKG